MFPTQGKPITCQAAVAWEKLKPLSIETVEVAPPEGREVRIKIVSAGICHSDLSYMKGDIPDLTYPILLGHEAAGIVESIGNDVTLFKPGDHVIPLFVPQCQECKLCKHPETNLCAKLIGTAGGFEDIPKSIKCKGKLLTQMTRIGSFSEYTVVPEISLTKINPNAPLEKMALFGCCIPTGYGSAVFCAKVRQDTTCVIWGLGGVGMAVVMGCRAQGASRIIGVDINPDKFPLAKKLGCTDVVNPKDHSEPIEKVIIKMTDGGADYTFVSVGNKAAADSALKATHIGWGKSILIGIVPGGEISTDPMALLMGRKWIGTFCGDTLGLTDIPKLVEKYMKGELPADELITHTLKLQDINEGFDMLKSGKSLRTVVIF